MRFGWAKALGLASVIALVSCGGGDADPAAKQKKEAAFFLKSNARADGVTTLPSGLQYKVVQSGPAGGLSPDANDWVSVDYEGALTDGTVFDSSIARGIPYLTAPEGIPPGNIIKGWTEILPLMHVGDEWLVYVPPELGYGDTGQGPIPPNSVLVFRLKLLNVAPAAGGGAPNLG